MPAIDFNILIPIVSTMGALVAAVLYLTRSRKNNRFPKVWTFEFMKDHTISIRQGHLMRKPKKGMARIQYSKDEAIALPDKVGEQPVPYNFLEKRVFGKKLHKVFLLFNKIPVDFSEAGKNVTVNPLLDDKDMVLGTERGSQQVLVKSETSKKDILFYGIIFLALGVMIGLVVAPYMPVPTARQVVIQTLNNTRILP